MKNIPQISNAEWEVMKIVWEKSPVATHEIIEKLSTETKWQPRTIRTLIDRLVQKGALAVNPQQRRPLSYTAQVPKDQYLKQESQSFLSRVFSGDTTPMLVHLVKSAKLSASDIEELKQTLKEKENHYGTSHSKN